MSKYKVIVTMELDETIEVKAKDTVDAMGIAEDEVWYALKKKYPKLPFTTIRAWDVEEIK